MTQKIGTSVQFCITLGGCSSAQPDPSLLLQKPKLNMRTCSSDIKYTNEFSKFSEFQGGLKQADTQNYYFTFKQSASEHRQFAKA